jgi:hypothetical protein
MAARCFAHAWIGSSGPKIQVTLGGSLLKTLARNASRIALALGLAAAQAQDTKEVPKWDVAAPSGDKGAQGTD